MIINAITINNSTKVNPDTFWILFLLIVFSIKKNGLNEKGRWKMKNNIILT
jgi:hypothetical protein